MRAQQRNAVQHRVQRRTHAAGDTAERRGQGHALHGHLGVGKQGAQLLHGHAAHVRVARVVVDEIVPQHRAARLHPAPHLLRQLLLHGGRQNRREHGEEHRQILAFRGDGLLQGGIERIGIPDAAGLGQHRSRSGRTLGQQLDALQAFGLNAELQPVLHVAARAAAHVQNIQRAPVGKLRRGQQCLHFDLTLLPRGSRVGVAQAVALGIARRIAACITPAHVQRFGLRRRIGGFRLAGVVGAAAHRVSAPQRACGPRPQSMSRQPQIVPQP